jgi:N-acetylglucosaminyldiphosphoundecaprenol N-acetyl-beta-D-mannosaminyltransferase
MPLVFNPIASVAGQKAWPRRIKLFGVFLDAVTMPEAVAVVTQWLTGRFERCRYIVTPNVDHVVLLQQQPALRAAYADAGLILADGWPVVLASKLMGHALPERVAGSDLVPALFQAMHRARARRVFLLGAAPGVADRAAENIQARWPAVRIVGTYSPDLGFESRVEENERILEMIAAAKPDLLIVGFGAPKQELWVHAHFHRIRAKAVVCAGATIDFLAGEKKRAPRWMQNIGLEWFHRLITEPRRMGKRYLRDAYIFPQLVWREWRCRRKSTSQSSASAKKPSSFDHVQIRQEYPEVAWRSDDRSSQEADLT